MSRRAKLITLVLVLSMLLATAGVVVSADGEIWHIVKWGENLTQIAAMYGVTVEEIMTANGITNPNLIYAGQKLLIPSSTPYITHIVQPGETLSSIAWPYIDRGIDAFVTIGDERCFEALRYLAASGVTSGESGAAGVAALMELCSSKNGEGVREALGLDRSSVILAISTEGITNTALYRRIVGDLSPR